MFFLKKDTYHENQQLKLFFIKDLLEKETNEDNFLTTNEILRILENRGISENRNTLPDDIQKINDYYYKNGSGLEIVSDKEGKDKIYYCIGGNFNLSELRLLSDAVVTSRFITTEKAEKLINKLGALGNEYENKELHRQIYIPNRATGSNEGVFINIDIIQKMINRKTAISFEYFDYDRTRKEISRGTKVCSPYRMALNEGNYYLVCHYAKHPDTFTNFRIDKMKNICEAEEPFVPVPNGFDLEQYLRTSFSMFSGNVERIKIKFRNRFAGAVMDRFGSDVMMAPYDDDNFTISVDVRIGEQNSSAFYSWIMKFGRDVEILSPTSVREGYVQMMREIAEMYGDNL